MPGELKSLFLRLSSAVICGLSVSWVISHSTFYKNLPPIEARAIISSLIEGYHLPLYMMPDGYDFNFLVLFLILFTLFYITLQSSRSLRSSLFLATAFFILFGFQFSQLQWTKIFLDSETETFEQSTPGNLNLLIACISIYGFLLLVDILKQRLEWQKILRFKGIEPLKRSEILNWKTKKSLSILYISIPGSLFVVSIVEFGTSTLQESNFPDISGLMLLTFLGLLIVVASHQIVGFGKPRTRKIEKKTRRKELTKTSRPHKVLRRNVSSVTKTSYLAPEPIQATELKKRSGWKKELGSIRCREWNRNLKGRLIWTRSGTYFERKTQGLALAEYVVNYQDIESVIGEEVSQRLSVTAKSGKVHFKVPSPLKVELDINHHIRYSNKYG